MPSRTPSVLGLALAGGASSRMGREKALALLAGEPLLARVLRRLAPQVAGVALSANGEPERFSAFGAPVLADPSHVLGCGPLAGVLAGLDYAGRLGMDMVATVPSDAPFLPMDLVARLASERIGDEIAFARNSAGDQPLFALWPLAVRSAIAAALEGGRRSAIDLIARAAHRAVLFETAEPDPFFNVNRPDDLEAAERWLAER